jgi:hypothetical protein
MPPRNHDAGFIYTRGALTCTETPGILMLLLVQGSVNQPEVLNEYKSN